MTETVAVRGAVVVTGTDTGVGKTVTTAAIATAAGAAGLQVAVVKPAQTGVLLGSSAGAAPGPESDEQTILRLADPPTTRTLATYPEPLAPLSAARVAGARPLDLTRVVAAVEQLTASHDLVLIEGAGGLLVPMGATADNQPWTVADLAMALDAPAVVVARAGLGTLNHVALTLAALAQRGTEAYVVIGAWPTEPELVHRTNLTDLAGDLAGVVPDGAGVLRASVFQGSAASWLSPRLHGSLDPATFRADWRM